MGYFITPCVATLGTLLCYLLLPHLVRTPSASLGHKSRLHSVSASGFVFASAAGVNVCVSSAEICQFLPERASA